MVLIEPTNWHPTPEFVLERFHVPKDWEIQLDGFPRGLDGVRVDVWLGDDLDKALSDLLDVLISSYRQKLLGDSVSMLDRTSTITAFRHHYKEAALAAAHRAKEEGRLAICQLFHLAVLKQLLLLTDQKLKQWREAEEESLAARGGDDFLRTQRLRQLRRNRLRLRYLVAHDALGMVRQIDSALRKKRKSLLLVEWPVPEEVVFNPLLQMGELGCEENIMEHYPLVLREPRRFRRVGKALLEPLRQWLPKGCVSEPKQGGGSLSELKLRRDRGIFPGYGEVELFLRQVMDGEEYRQHKACWIDHPRNLSRLFDDGVGEVDWDPEQWPAFQEQLLTVVEQNLERGGHLEPLLASVRLREVYSSLGRKGIPSLLLEYLMGNRGLEDLVATLDRFNEVPDLPIYREALSSARNNLRRASVAERRRWLLKALEGFLALRRDLKLAWRAYQVMEQFRVLRNPDELRLAKANGLLQDFTPGAGVGKNVRLGHVILKADLRGSTALIAELKRVGINPAVYFTRNLFEPINTLLRLFGAEKVFLEGDAAILAFDERSGEEGFAVARACGLAVQLIALVNDRNRENRNEGLPELELGVGVCYEEGEPTYLFDEGRKITISPAIHRADRLSSSNLPGEIGASVVSALGRLWRVAEVKVVKRSASVSDDAPLYRYNVNGIELDGAAFDRLRKEVALKSLPAERLGGEEGERFYLGEYPSETGKTHWLVVREAPVALWGDTEEVAKEQKKGEVRYYEVVAVPDVARKIRQALRSV